MGTEIETIERRVRGFSEVCRRYGLKATHQRTEIYRELARTQEHPDAETVYHRVRRRIPAISLDTVYRTLRLLEDKGIISRVGYHGERTRFDANTRRHHHFICTECGFVGDVYDEDLNDLRAPKGVSTMGRVNSVHVELRGICTNCQGRRSDRSQQRPLSWRDTMVILAKKEGGPRDKRLSHRRGSPVQKADPGQKGRR